MAQLESVEYDTFDYKTIDEAPLSLEDAVKKAAQLRTSDTSHFHRIVPTDPSMISFRVDSIPREAVYSEYLSRWTGLLHRLILKPQKR